MGEKKKVGRLELLAKIVIFLFSTRDRYRIIPSSFTSIFIEGKLCIPNPILIKYHDLQRDSQLK